MTSAAVLALTGGLAAAGGAGAGEIEPAPPIAVQQNQADKDIEQLKRDMEALKALAAYQQGEMDRQSQELEAQRQKMALIEAGLGGPGYQIGTFAGPRPAAVPLAQAGGAARIQTVQAPAPAQTMQQQPQPQPQPQPQQQSQPQTQGSVDAPRGTNVLTPPGRFVIEPSLEFSHTSSNRFVVGGAAVLDTVLIGAFEATQARRETVTATLGVRTGIMNRLEGEIRIPYVYRSDRTTNTILATETTTATTDISSHDLGDIEAALHYQLNEARPGEPVLIANLRVKSDSGRGPYDVSRTTSGPTAGLETELPTGSGFWGIEPSVTFLMPSDPVVFFGNIGYMWNIARDINKSIGGALVERVDPGDSIRFSVGMGLAMNERTSFSLSYSYDYIYPTDTRIDGVKYSTETLHVGALTFGVNYQLRDDFGINFSVGAGLTEDAPDMRMILRTPFSF
ncbi:transporter [Telmatospirillum sp. J64-1]|uniref:transporter n=1 Tax=Telmatospirillum sp. J64-1 TaxID=2502183 RepID=UPI001C8F1FE2|nr:transporter [Telmatospirillum sp. J64-1]